jgi:hypothetical protein
MLVAALGHASATSSCREDPGHNVGDTWTCEDGCNTCTCEVDGSIVASGCAAEEGKGVDPLELEREAFEETIVRIAISVALLVLLFCASACFFMCVKGGNPNASQLVHELEEAENASVRSRPRRDRRGRR